MMEIKARFKSVEDFPEEEFCCPAAEHIIPIFAGREVTLTEANEYNQVCAFCGHDSGILPGFKTKEFTVTIPAYVLDIDAGGLS